MAKSPIVRSPNAFAIEIDFRRDVGDPTRIFRVATNLIIEIARFDAELAKVVNVGIRSNLALEEVENGSLRIWLVSLLNAVDDDALKNLDWKKIVGNFLFLGKQKLLEYLSSQGATDLQGDGRGLELLREELLGEARSLDVATIPPQVAPTQTFFVYSIVAIAEALKPLLGEETVVLESQSGKRIPFSRSVTLSSQDVSRLVVKSEPFADKEVTVPVKKPDLIGDSKWEFIYEGHAIEAKIMDGPWLASFRNNEVPLPPGSLLRISLRTTSGLNAEHDAMSTKYEVMKVHQVVPPPVLPEQIVLQ